MNTQTETGPTKLVYTVKEAADVLCIGYSTARERIRCGELRSFKDGSRRLIAGEDLLTYIRRRRESPIDG
ncbi:MAG: helix-turn-helix domain-containing protein [Actinomycetia bacterium]|nr:helix-turn-helix domain-containing protein [Actinomycetes bacterium]